MSQIFEKLQDIVNSTQADIDKFYEGGNKAAGTRVRKAMQEVKNLAQDLRKEVQAKKKFSASLKRGISSIGKLSLAREAILVRSSRKDVKIYTKRVVDAILFCQKAGMTSSEIEEIMFDREHSTIEDSKGDQSE